MKGGERYQKEFIAVRVENYIELSSLLDISSESTRGRSVSELPYSVIIIIIIIIIIKPLTARVVGAPQMISQPIFSIFPCSPLPSETCRTPGLFVPYSDVLQSSKRQTTLTALDSPQGWVRGLQFLHSRYPPMGLRYYRPRVGITRRR